MRNPELFALSRVGWQYFGTLTFARDGVSEKVQVTMFFSLIRTLAKNSGVHFRRLLWCLRRENGEALGRLHFHFVIGGLPARYVSQVTCFSLMNKWESLGGGMARVREYDTALDGVGYIL